VQFPFAQQTGKLCSIEAGRLRQNGDTEKSSAKVHFIAAKTRGRVHGANLSFDPLRNFFQSTIPRQMAVSVVDALETVDVDHQAGDAAGVPLRAPGTTNMLRIASVGPDGDADI